MVLALARGGVPATDPAIAGPLQTLRARYARPDPASGDGRTSTYAASCFLWMLSEVRPEGFGPAAGQAALALASGFHPSGLWPYRLPTVAVNGRYARIAAAAPAGGRPPDLSNTQFAVLGLLAAERMGVWTGRDLWGRVRDGMRELAGRDGGFPYQVEATAPAAFRRPTRAMTVAGATNLLVALRRLGASAEQAVEDRDVMRARAWLDRHRMFDAGGRWVPRGPEDVADVPPDFALLSLERLGSLAGLDRLGGTDWFHVGAADLLRRQRGDGAWDPAGAGFAYLDSKLRTALAILFLTRAADALPATTPALTSGDLVGGRDLPEPLYGDLLARAAAVARSADGDTAVAWRRAFVAQGVRGLEGLAALVEDGRPGRSADAEHWLSRLTSAPPPEGPPVDRSRAWARWIDERRTRLQPSKAGTEFIEAE